MRKPLRNRWRPAWPPGAAVGVGWRREVVLRLARSRVGGSFWLRGRRAERAAPRMLGTKTIVGCRPRSASC